MNAEHLQFGDPAGFRCCVTRTPRNRAERGDIGVFEGEAREGASPGSPERPLFGTGGLPLTPARKPPLCAGRGAGRGDYSPDAPPRPARLRRRDIDAPINYRKNKHVLYGEQEGMCAGWRTHFPFKVFDVDHIIPESKGGTDHIDNLQLLCSHCNRTKGNRPQEYLIARLKELEYAQT